MTAPLSYYVISAINTIYGNFDMYGVVLLSSKKNLMGFVLVLNCQILLVFISFGFDTKKLMALILF